MSWIFGGGRKGGGNKGNNNNNNNDDNNNDDPSSSDDTTGCSYCDNGMSASCPYWRQGKDGHMYHDQSGVAGYMDTVIMGDDYGIGNDLPKTPQPGKDDDEPPKRGGFRLW